MELINSSSWFELIEANLGEIDSSLYKLQEQVQLLELIRDKPARE